MKRSQLQTDNRGFTILELLIAIGIASVLLTVLLSITLNYYGDTIRNNQASQMAVGSYYATRAMLDDIRMADSVASTNAITDANKTGGWTTSDTNNVLVLNEPAVDSSNNIIYNPSTGYPYENEYIYFISNNTLYKRTLKNTNAAGNVAVTSCPAAQATASCPTDKTYVTNINDLGFTLYDDNNATTTTASSARSIKLNIALSKKSFGTTIAYTNSTQATLRNR